VFAPSVSQGAGLNPQDCGCRAGHQLQPKGHGLGQKPILAGFYQLPGGLPLGFGGGIGIRFNNEVADKHIGSDARLASCHRDGNEWLR